VHLMPSDPSSSAPHLEPSRTVMTLTAVPSEIPLLVNQTLNNLLFKQSLVVDVIYLNIPYIQLRDGNALYPSTNDLQNMFPQDRVVIHRILGDCGPTTRYLGAIELESNPEAIVMTMDHDPWNVDQSTVQQLVEYAQFDAESVWTVWGENMVWNPVTGYWAVDYWRYPLVINESRHRSWNEVEILRAVNGVAFRRKWLDDIWFNATDYHIGCFWTDDHWFSFNMARQGVSIKLIHDYAQSVREREERLRSEMEHRRLGTLTEVNSKLNSESECTISIMQHHDDVWLNVRNDTAS